MTWKQYSRRKKAMLRSAQATLPTAPYPPIAADAPASTTDKPKLPAAPAQVTVKTEAPSFVKAEGTPPPAPTQTSVDTVGPESATIKTEGAEIESDGLRLVKAEGTSFVKPCIHSGAPGDLSVGSSDASEDSGCVSEDPAPIE